MRSRSSSTSAPSSTSIPPHAATSDADRDAYVFEKPVTVANEARQRLEGHALASHIRKNEGLTPNPSALGAIARNSYAEEAPTIADIARNAARFDGKSHGNGPVVAAMAVTECLYCPATGNRPFANAEHVLPKSFGTFESRHGNLTLHNVCPDCNGYFGRKLEQYFGRDTIDAYFRLLSGVKAAKKASEVGGHRLRFSIEEPGSEFHGSWMTLAYDSQREIVMEAPPQVAFRRRDETEWQCYLERDLTEDRVQELRTSEFRIYGQPENVARIMERMQLIGLAPESGLWTDISEQTKNPTFETVRIRYVVDEVVMRTVAKIAFNYLAHGTEQQVPGFVRREEFAPIRAFIRHGTRPSWNPVGIGSAAADLGDTRKMRITSGHVLAAAWADPRSVPVGNVSLFTQVTYIVRFTDRAPGVWWDLVSGHYFDLPKRGTKDGRYEYSGAAAIGLISERRITKGPAP